MRKHDSYIDENDSDEVTRDGESVRVPMVIMDGRPTAAADARRAAKAARVRWVQSLTDAWRSPQRDTPPPEFTCPSCKGTGEDVEGDSPDGRCDECEGTGYIRGPNNTSSSLREDPGKYPDTDLKVDRKRKSGGDDDDDDEPNNSRRRGAARGTDARSIADARAHANASYHAMVRRLQDAWRTPSHDGAEPDAGTQLLHRHLRGTEEDDNAAAAREKRYAAYKARLESAWRNPAAAAKRNETQLEAWRKPGAWPGLHQDATNDSAAAYAAYVERIGRAWKAT